MKRNEIIYVGDFETTTYEGITETEVWASASVELYTENVNVFHSIAEQFQFFLRTAELENTDIIAYYHNLKFDGSFWLDYLLRLKTFKQAYVKTPTGYEWLNTEDMPAYTYKYNISDKGQWYNIIIKTSSRIIEIRDSLKLLPFSVKKIGKSFGTKHKKLDMEYEGKRYAGCEITPEEMEYIKNDVLVVKEALEITFQQGHTGLTIGSCCLREYKTLLGRYDFANFFPDLKAIELQPVYKYENADKYIRKSYKGGWCYVVKGKENIKKYHGLTADVNSLYPSMMSSQSGNAYAVSKRCLWRGSLIRKDAIKADKYFFLRIKTRFHIKPNYLPFIQIKGNPLYQGNECLTTSDIKVNGEYVSYWTDEEGNYHDTRVELTLTCTDYALFKEHYNLSEFEILDGCWFFSQIGIFDDYIDKYKKIKMESEGAVRELAKLFLNNLYGKLATSPLSGFKVAYLKEDTDSVGFINVPDESKDTVHIACGSAITSYARNFTIRTAQKNYHGVNERGFIYADTDSIHCDLFPWELVDVPVHPTEFCHWKLESFWDEGLFVRQKTYTEHVWSTDKGVLDEPYYNIKCAGLPDRCKDMFVESLKGKHTKKLTPKQEEWIKNNPHVIDDFKEGLRIYGMLRPKRIKGGIVLVEDFYEMKGNE